MLTLVTVIYGDNRRYLVELYGSVLSILQQRGSSDTHVVVYTDRPLTDFPLPITQRIITPDEWNNWTRGSAVTHLVKLHIVGKTLKEFSGPVIYFDTDTLFREAPETLAARLSKDTSIMHADEGAIQHHDVWSNIVRWLGDGRYVAGAKITGGSVMYNSGIVGVVPEHADALEKSVSMAEELFGIDPIFSLDQFSTGVALSMQTTVLTCEAEVLHYWGWQRGFVRLAIDRFWAAHVDSSVAELCREFDPLTLSASPGISWLDKIKVKLTMVWLRLDRSTEFSLLTLESALRAASEDKEIANIWFNVHLQMLRTDAKASISEKLLQQLEYKHAACADWLDADNRQAVVELQSTISATRDGHHLV